MREGVRESVRRRPDQSGADRFERAVDAASYARHMQMSGGSISGERSNRDACGDRGLLEGQEFTRVARDGGVGGRSPAGAGLTWGPGLGVGI